MFFFNKISVDAVSNGRQLHKAIEKDVNFFVKCRSENKVRKAMVGLWLILYEDNDWVYWGYPKFRWMFNNNRIIEILYKTEKKGLQELYPDFRKDY